jgi:hypothetical protein
MTVTERRSVATVPLDAVCTREGVWPDCLKLDVEGAELDVLRGAEAALEQALVLDVEVEFAELFRGQPLFAEVDLHLRERGWRLLGLRRVCWRRDAGLRSSGVGYGGQLVAGDALYVNTAALDEGVPPARALKLAVILSAYRQYDFALALLRKRPLSGVPASERLDLERALVPPASAARRLALLALRRLGAERRRTIADGLQGPGATVWQDTHHF